MFHWMFKKCTTFILLVLLLFLFSCSTDETKAPVILDSPICIDSQSNCSNTLPHGEISLLFDRDKVINESEFTIHLQYTGEKKLKNIKAYIEGKDMFMGKIPLLFYPDDNNPQVFIANGQLGSCTNNEMVWTLVVVLKYKSLNEDTVIEEVTYFDFTSYK